jgi:hypothetical protein
MMKKRPPIDWESPTIKRQLLELMRRGVSLSRIAVHFERSLSAMRDAIRKHTHKVSQQNWEAILAAGFEGNSVENTAIAPFIKRVFEFKDPDPRCQGFTYAEYCKMRNPRRANEPIPFKNDYRPVYTKSLE